MSTLTKRIAKANYVVLTPPGEVLKEMIFEIGMGVCELALHCKLPIETMQGILDTTTEMTQNIAEKLEHVIRIHVDSWMRREEKYRKRIILAANTQKHSMDEELGVAIKNHDT